MVRRPKRRTVNTRREVETGKMKVEKRERERGDHGKGGRCDLREVESFGKKRGTAD